MSTGKASTPNACAITTDAVLRPERATGQMHPPSELSHYFSRKKPRSYHFGRRAHEEARSSAKGTRPFRAQDRD